jgi:hypothetical protein
MDDSNQDKRFCEYEQRQFSVDEFTYDAKWGIVHEREPRHTVGGTVIDRESNGPLPSIDAGDEDYSH